MGRDWFSKRLAQRQKSVEMLIHANAGAKKKLNNTVTFLYYREICI
jgi:hypothetical protein